jgi:hypothetical protein
MAQKPIENSMQVLKTLYMIVAALAITFLFEEFMSNPVGEFELRYWSIHFVVFLVLLTTIVRFVHGAMRHIDKCYIERSSTINWRIRQPLIDFAMLFGEAFLFFVMAGLLRNSWQFVLYYLILLGIDTGWLLVVNVRHKSMKDIMLDLKGTPCNWIMANMIVIIVVSPVITVGWRETGLLITLAATVTIHTIIDYVLNWQFYFEKPSEA